MHKPAAVSIMFIGILLLTLLLIVSTAAQEPQQPFLSGDLGTQDASTACPSLDQSGLSFRYLQTFGVPEVPYFDDATHLNAPWGLGTEGTQVWIAECAGRRALKYAGDGTFIQQIGEAGFRYSSDTVVECLNDVAVDGSGDTWLVDSIHHVIKFDPAGNLISELGVPREPGTSNDRFDWPYGIAFDNAGHIYISDRNNHRIQVFDSAESYVTTIGVTGVSGSDDAHFDSPRHITVDSNDRLYVADGGNHRVQIFDVSDVMNVSRLATLGVSAQSGSGNSHFDTPEGVAVDVGGGRLYVADGSNSRVQVFDYTTWAYQTTLSGFSYTTDVALDSAGNLYVAEPWASPSQVQQFDSSLNYARTFGTPNVPYLSDEYHYNQPAGVAVTPDGSLYIGESRGRRLLRLGATGIPRWIRGKPGVWGDDPNHFWNVEDVDVDTRGRVYAADGLNCRIQIYASDGSFYGSLGKDCGSGNDQFNEPYGVAIGENDILLVADTNNHRVQIFDSDLVYAATLGETGVPGSDNAHFAAPRDVDVDLAGNIYVVDQNNHRVQVFDSSGIHILTIGESGVAGDDFDHLDSPTAVTVDACGRIYVADDWGLRIQVFDTTGAYLTTVGGNNGSGTGDLRDAEGLAVDAAGYLYVAERENHRIQVFAPGVPGWAHMNVNGFGDRENIRIGALSAFDGNLYAGTDHTGGAEVWRKGSGWMPANAPGFGITENVGINHLIGFEGYLYAGTDNHEMGGEVWRSNDGATWTRVVSQGYGTQVSNTEVTHFGVFDDMLYASASSADSGDVRGAQIWRTAEGLTWTNVVTGGFGDAGNLRFPVVKELDGQLYAGSLNEATGGQLWRSSSGESGSWTQVNSDGFGSASNEAVTDLALFQGYLYASTRNWDTGAELWRSPDGTAWSKAVGDGIGEGADRAWLDGLAVFDNMLYLIVHGHRTGIQILRSADGTSWQQVSPDGFGDSNTTGTENGSAAIAMQDGRLYIGTHSPAKGGGVWKKTVTAGFAGSPTSGPPPLAVSFTNASAGDYTTSLWDFGDGSTSAETDPVHAYSFGEFTVTLTVSDGVDSNTVTRSGYIEAVRRVDLPVATKGSDPYSYDDFDDHAFDGSYDHARWFFSGDDAFQARQKAGSLVFKDSAAPKTTGAGLVAQRPWMRTLAELQQFEARLKLSSDRKGGWASVRILYSAEDVAGHGWYTDCRLGASSSPGPVLGCSVMTNSSGTWIAEYVSQWILAAYDTWYTVRIDTNPNTARLRFYVDGKKIGNYTPKDAADLITHDNFRPQVSVWNGDRNTSATRRVDDVRITPAQP